MDTRTINIQLVEQVQKQRIVKFMPVRLTAADSDVLLKQHYSVRVDADGSATIALPVRSSGTITYQYEMPAVNGVSKGKFNLEAGASIDLADLIEGSPEASDDIRTYIDQAVRDLRPYKVYAAIVNQSGTNAPTATVLEDTFDEDLVWSYSDVGSYFLEGFSWGGGHVVVIVGQAPQTPGAITLHDVDILGGVWFDTRELSGGSYVSGDGLWLNQFIEIRLYDE